MRPHPLHFRDILALSGFLLAALVAVFAPFPSPQLEPSERTIRVEASRFAYQPGIIRANPGDRITIELVSMDVVHGLSLDGYDIEIAADPGQTSTLSFTADQNGIFRFRCSVTCGDMHPFMIGKLQVGPNTLLWRASALTLVVSTLGLWRWKK